MRARVFDDDLLCQQSALQGIPGVDVFQHIGRPQHQVAAVGAMQGPGAQHGKVQHILAHLHVPLDAAQQIHERGIRLKHDRRAARLAVIDQHVHLKAQQRIERWFATGRFGRLARFRAEVGSMGDDIGVHFLQILGRFRARGLVTRQQLIEQRIDHLRRRLLLEFLQFRARGQFQIVPAAQHGIEIVLDRRLGLFQGSPLLAGQGRQIVGRRRLALRAERGYEQSLLLGLRQRKSLRPRALIEFLQDRRALIFQFTHQLRRRALIGFTLKRAAQIGCEDVHQAGHILLEGARAPRGQAHGARAQRLLEVIHIDPVAGRRLPGRVLDQRALGGRHPSRSTIAQHKDVEARPAHVETEIDGAQGARLANDIIDERQLVGGFELQRRRPHTRRSFETGSGLVGIFFSPSPGFCATPRRAALIDDMNEETRLLLCRD